MRVLGIGTDLVATRRFDRLIARGGRRFLDRWFAPAEVAYCLGTDRPGQHAAARFAAKEASLKALGIAGASAAIWREIEVVRDHAGRPAIVLHGSARAAAEMVGVSGVQVSLSHDADYATATALALGGGWEGTAGRAGRGHERVSPA